MPLIAINKNKGLVMEVARFKYSSAWISLKMLYNSMKAVDFDFPDKLRGFSIISS